MIIYGPSKKAAGIGKINTVLNNIGESLFFVPFKSHGFSVFTFCKDVNAEISLSRATNSHHLCCCEKRMSLLFSGP